MVYAEHSRFENVPEFVLPKSASYFSGEIRRIPSPMFCQLLIYMLSYSPKNLEKRWNICMLHTTSFHQNAFTSLESSAKKKKKKNRIRSSQEDLPIPNPHRTEFFSSPPSQPTNQTHRPCHMDPYFEAKETQNIRQQVFAGGHPPNY